MILFLLKYHNCYQGSRNYSIFIISKLNSNIEHFFRKYHKSCSSIPKVSIFDFMFFQISHILVSLKDFYTFKIQNANILFPKKCHKIFLLFQNSNIDRFLKKYHKSEQLHLLTPFFLNFFMIEFILINTNLIYVFRIRLLIIFIVWNSNSKL